MEQTITIAVDLAKSVFQLRGETVSGEVVFERRFSRAQFDRFMQHHAASLVVMEACGTSHYWARRLMAMGHQVRLLAPCYVKPCVRRNKTDARDAAAILAASRQPDMRSVRIKSEAEACGRALERARELLVRQRTQVGNCLRGLLAEFGITASPGGKGLESLIAKVEALDAQIPTALVVPLSGLARQWRHLETEALALEADIRARAQADPVMRRLMSVPGVGPLTAHAVACAIGDGRQFRCGRDFAAWVGLTPRAYASGQTRRTLGISKKGDASLRRLLTLGASAHFIHLRKRPDKAGPWITGILARRPMRVAVVAQAARTARILWAVLTREQSYRVEGPGLANPAA